MKKIDYILLILILSFFLLKKDIIKLEENINSHNIQEIDYTIKHDTITLDSIIDKINKNLKYLKHEFK